MLFTTLALLALPAWADDALWTTMTAHTKKAQQLVAGDIDLAMTLSKAGGNPVARHFRLHLSGWAQDKPVYASTEVDAPPGAPKGKGESSADMVKSITKIGDMLLEPDAKVTRADGQPKDGKSWTVFKRREEGVGRKMVATIWVDADTGCPHLVDSDLHISLYVDGNMKTSYAMDEQGRCVPRQLDADFAIIIPFKGMKMKLTQISSNWVAHPAH